MVRGDDLEYFIVVFGVFVFVFEHEGEFAEVSEEEDLNKGEFGEGETLLFRSFEDLADELFVDEEVVGGEFVRRKGGREGLNLEGGVDFVVFFCLEEHLFEERRDVGGAFLREGVGVEHVDELQEEVSFSCSSEIEGGFVLGFCFVLFDGFGREGEPFHDVVDSSEGVEVLGRFEEGSGALGSAEELLSEEGVILVSGRGYSFCDGTDGFAEVAGELIVWLLVEEGEELRKEGSR